jgi:predicted ATPase
MAGTSPFLGRARELSRLRDAWRASAAGRAQLVLVSGEAGIGKTRLVDELRMHVDAVSVDQGQATHKKTPRLAGLF